MIVHVCEYRGDIGEGYNIKLDTVDREIFVLKIFRALKFHGAKFS